MSHRVIHKLHRWLGLAALIVIVVETLSGVIVSFHDEIHRALYPTLSAADTAAPQRPMDDLIANLRAQLPDMRIQRAVFPHASTEPIWFRVVRRDGTGSRQFVLVNPASAQILEQGSFATFPCELALTLHASFLAGAPGVTAVGLSGVALFLLGVTGTVLWWPRGGPLSKHLTVRWSASRVVLLMDLHKVFGIVAVVALLMLSLTGAAIALRAWLPDPPRHVETLTRVVPPKLPVQPMAADIVWAQRMLPDAAITRVFFRDQPDLVSISAVRLGAATLPHPRAFHELRFDPSAPEVVQLSRYERASLATRVLDWMLPVHAGEFAGMSGRVVVFIAGWFLLLISISGVWMWWDRRSIRRRARAATRPAAKSVPGVL